MHTMFSIRVSHFDAFGGVVGSLEEREAAEAHAAAVPVRLIGCTVFHVSAAIYLLLIRSNVCVG